MKYKFNFTIRGRQLEEIVKSIQKLPIKLKLKKPDVNFQNLSETARASYIIVFAAVGLLEFGYDEEKTIEILKTLLEISIDDEDLSPGNLKDKQ